MPIPKKPLAIIPARGNSKRFPRKNIAILAGKPLIAYAIEAARDSEIFDLVCVSSEDDEILEIAEEWGAQAVLKRPEELSR
jgi:CMP-N-acetylneuraminic acid synthetase